MKKLSLLPKCGALFALLLAGTMTSCIEDDYDPCPYDASEFKVDPWKDNGIDAGIDWTKMNETIKVKKGDYFYANNSGTIRSVNVVSAEPGKVVIKVGNYEYTLTDGNDINYSICKFSTGGNSIYLLALKPNSTELMSCTLLKDKRILKEAKRTRFFKPKGYDFMASMTSAEKKEWKDAKETIKLEVGMVVKAKHGCNEYEFKCIETQRNGVTLKFTTGEKVSISAMDNQVCLANLKTANTSNLPPIYQCLFIVDDYSPTIYSMPEYDDHWHGKMYEESGIRTYFKIID